VVFKKPTGGTGFFDMLNSVAATAGKWIRMG